MRKIIKKIILLGTPAFVLFSFNNCMKSGFVATSDVLDASSQSLAVLQGKTLYTNNCSGCHGPIETSQKLGRSTSDIMQAISSQPEMKFLAILGTDQIQLISTALNASLGLPPINNDQPTEYIALTANRYMLKSNFQELFVADSGQDSSDAAINTVIDNLIGGHPEAFGGNCTRNDPGCTDVCGAFASPECAGKLDTSITASNTPTMSAVSQGYLIRACEEILSIDKAVQTAVSKADLNSSKEPNLSDVIVLMNYFYRDKPFDADAATALADMASQTKAKGYSILDQWRFVVLPLCTSSANELL